VQDPCARFPITYTILFAVVKSSKAGIVETLSMTDLATGFLEEVVYFLVGDLGFLQVLHRTRFRSNKMIGMDRCRDSNFGNRCGDELEQSHLGIGIYRLVAIVSKLDSS
jgi:hypothetical protein